MNYRNLYSFFYIFITLDRLSMEDVCQELVQFLRLSTRLELKLTATKNVLSLTGSLDGRKLILGNSGLLEVKVY